jgi:hypothetical protein
MISIQYLVALSLHRLFSSKTPRNHIMNALPLFILLCIAIAFASKIESNVDRFGCLPRKSVGLANCPTTHNFNANVNAPFDNDLDIINGDTVEAGFQFGFNGNCVTKYSFTFCNLTVTLPLICATNNGNTTVDYTFAFPSITYVIPGNTALFPTGTPYQSGEILIPVNSLCPNGQLSYQTNSFATLSGILNSNAVGLLVSGNFHVLLIRNETNGNNTFANGSLASFPYAPCNCRGNGSVTTAPPTTSPTPPPPGCTLIANDGHIHGEAYPASTAGSLEDFISGGTAPYTFTVSNAVNGQIAQVPGNVYIFNADQNFSGIGSFDYTVSDSSNPACFGSGTVFVNVTGGCNLTAMNETIPGNPSPDFTFGNLFPLASGGTQPYFFETYINNFGGSANILPDGTFVFTPGLGFSGNAFFEFVLSDSSTPQCSVIGRVTVVVPAATIPPPTTHLPPTIDPIGNQIILENSPKQFVSLTGIAADEISDVITITATSSNPALIPTPLIIYTSPSTTGTLQYSVIPFATGMATITVIVDDNDGGVTMVSFTVTVLPVNQPPTLDPIPDPAPIAENSPKQTIFLTGITPGVGDFGQTVIVTATSSNLAVIPNPTVFYTNPSTTGSLQYAPVPFSSGSSVITVTVTDNLGLFTTKSFTVFVFPVQQPPTLDPISDPAAIPINSGTQIINLSGISAGPGQGAQFISITATSSNTGLIPNPTVSYTSPSSTGFLSYNPVAGQSGSAVVTVTVFASGGSSIMRTFNVVVNP